MASLTLTIDGQSVKCDAKCTVLAAADTAEIYIPRMCSHPDLPAISEVTWSEAVQQLDVVITGEKPNLKAGEEAHCNLCLVEVEGRSEPVRACDTPVQEGMIVHTDSDEVVLRRRQALSQLLADHPHACLTCAQKEGCSRTDCSTNVPVDERCCVLLGRCELEKVSAYIGISGDTPKYIPRQRPRSQDDPLFEWDYNLCIGCLRCVRICRKIHGTDILGAVWKDNRAWVGTLEDSETSETFCRSCGACVEICPTGALLDKESVPAVRRGSPLPCVGECPAGIDIPRYVRAIAAGRYQEALDIVRSRVPFPGILGYVCFHPCETNCRRGALDQPVAICDLKRFVADYEPEGAFAPTEKQPATGKKVAVIGSGPTGATAAYYLALLGHEISLYDRESKPGGMLRYGIPDYRLPSEVLDREMTALETMGVSFHMGHSFESENWLDELKVQGFDAVLVATGASLSKDLPIENSDLVGIYPGLEFLKSAKVSQTPSLEGQVVVIGGGNVAIDAAMTATRLGAKPVHLVCLEKRDEMPAHDWETVQAEEEGVEIHPAWGPKRYTANDGRVSGVEFKRCTRVFDDRGQFAPQYDDNEITHLPADTVIVTIGQQADMAFLLHAAEPAKGSGQTLNVGDDYILGREGVFAAGDLIRGPSSVADAVADGRQVAEVIDRHLGGNGLVDDVPAAYPHDTSPLGVTKEQFQQTRQKVEIAGPETRKTGFGLISQTLTESAARSEAQRCLQCFHRQQIRPVVLPPELWQPLTEEEVAAVPAVEGVFQLLDAEKKALRITGTQNIQQNLMECLENRGDARWFIWEEDPMYTKRESELIQQHLQKYGELPGGGGDDGLDDLF